MRVQQEGIAEHDADDGDRVSDAQYSNYSGTITKPKESMQGDNQVAAVPAAHAKRQSNQHTLNRAQAPATGNQLNSHPQR